MSLSSSYNVTAAVFEANINAQDWKILAELIIDTTGAKFLIQTKDGRQLVIKCTDYVSTGSVSVSNFPATQPVSAVSLPTHNVILQDGTTASVAKVRGNTPSPTDMGLVTRPLIVNPLPVSQSGLWQTRTFDGTNYVTFTIGQVLFSMGIPVHVDGGDVLQTGLIGFGGVGTVPESYGGGETEVLGASSSGTSRDSVSGVKHHSLLVTSPPATWDVRLEGSIDGTNFSQILAHTQVDGAGTTKFTTTPFACRYVRVRRADAIAGNATITKWSNP